MKFLFVCNLIVSGRRRSYLPQDLCVREGVADEDVLRGQNSECVSNVAFEVAKQAKVSTSAPHSRNSSFALLSLHALGTETMAGHGCCTFGM